MTSSEGESFAFRSAVAVDGPVEVGKRGGAHRNTWRQGLSLVVRHKLPSLSTSGAAHYVNSALAHHTPPTLLLQAWMTGVEAEMRTTLAAVMKEGVWNYAKASRSRWILDSLGMVTLAGSQVRARLVCSHALRSVHVCVQVGVQGYL